MPPFYLFTDAAASHVLPFSIFFFFDVVFHPDANPTRGPCVHRRRLSRLRQHPVLLRSHRSNVLQAEASTGDPRLPLLQPSFPADSELPQRANRLARLLVPGSFPGAPPAKPLRRSNSCPAWLSSTFRTIPNADDAARVEMVRGLRSAPSRAPISSTATGRRSVFLCSSVNIHLRSIITLSSARSASIVVA